MLLGIPTLINALVWLNGLARAYSVGNEALGVDSPFCRRENYTLFCDYTSYQQVIRLEQQLPKEIRYVVIYGGKKLYLSNCVCADMVFSNIHTATVLPVLICPCNKKVALTVKNSSLSIISNYVHQLTIEDSVVTTLTSTKLKVLHLINVEVKILNVVGLKKIQIINSTISLVQKLQLSNNARFYMKEPINQLIEPFPVASHMVSGQDDVQACSDCYSYFAPFIVCAVLLIITFCTTVPYIVYLRKSLNNINSQMSNPEKNDYRKDSKFLENQIIQKKEEYIEEKESLLEDVDVEQYQCVLENTSDLNDKLQSTFQVEKSKYKESVAEIISNCERAIENLKKDSEENISELEISKDFELHALEAQYEEAFSSPTLLFWEKIKDVLEKSKAFNKELIEERYLHWLNDAITSDEAEKLQEKVDFIRINKEFIDSMANAIKEHLRQWPNILNLMKETHIKSDTAEKLFTMLENLMTAHHAAVELSYDRRIKEQDNKYLSESEEQQEKLSEICSKLLASISEEKEHLSETRSKHLESKLPLTKKYITEIENLYSVREQLLDAKLKFEIKNAEDKYSEIQLKLLHLNVILEIQEEHKNNLTQNTAMSISSMNFCARVLQLGLYEESQYNTKGRKGSKSKEIFMDRYAQA